MSCDDVKKCRKHEPSLAALSSLDDVNIVDVGDDVVKLGEYTGVVTLFLCDFTQSGVSIKWTREDCAFVSVDVKRRAAVISLLEVICIKVMTCVGESLG